MSDRLVSGRNSDGVAGIRTQSATDPTLRAGTRFDFSRPQMSLPRPVVPNKTYLITRRVSQRQFWLRPTALTTQIFLYCVAYAAAIFGIKVHAMMVMSNHWHAVITDVRGCYPDFLHRVHLLVAKCINASYGRWENLWSSDDTSVVELCDDDAVFEKIVYTLNNPVAAGLVAFGDEWPGLRTTPEDWAGAPYVVDRPPVHFSDTGKMPAQLELRIVRPPIYGHLSDDALVRGTRLSIQKQETGLRKAILARGGSFLGAEACKTVDPASSPTTPAPRRNLKPRFATRSAARLRDAVNEHKSWLRSYARSVLALVRGAQDVVFPAGTWGRRHTVCVAAYTA